MENKHFIWSQRREPQSTHLPSPGVKAVRTQRTNTLRFHFLHPPPVRVRRRKTLVQQRLRVKSSAPLPAKELGLYFCGHNRKSWGSFWRTDRVSQLIFRAGQQHSWDKSLVWES